MDIAVDIVQAYLRINGYFTVSEYPVVEAMHRGGYRAVTDLDILAVRFPGAGRQVHGPKRKKGTKKRLDIFKPDPALGKLHDHVDMIIGEVKEGRAELNLAASDPDVLKAVLARFGCCPADSVDLTVEQLLGSGRAVLPNEHHVRLMAFGSNIDESRGQNFEAMELGHAIHFIRDYLREHWEVLRHAQFKDPALGFLMALEKAT